jgi:hypothetical protein
MNKSYILPASIIVVSGDPEMQVQELIRPSNHVGVNTLWTDDYEDTKLSLNNQLINHIEYFWYW